MRPQASEVVAQLPIGLRQRVEAPRQAPRRRQRQCGNEQCQSCDDPESHNRSNLTVRFAGCQFEALIADGPVRPRIWTCRGGSSGADHGVLCHRGTRLPRISPWTGRGSCGSQPGGSRPRRSYARGRGLRGSIVADADYADPSLQTRITRIHRCGCGLRRSNDMTRGAQHGFTPVASFGQNASIAAARSRPARAPRKHPSDPRSLETGWRDPRPVAREIRVIRVPWDGNRVIRVPWDRDPRDPRFPWDSDPREPRPGDQRSA